MDATAKIEASLRRSLKRATGLAVESVSWISRHTDREFAAFEIWFPERDIPTIEAFLASEVGRNFRETRRTERRLFIEAIVGEV